MAYVPTNLGYYNDPNVNQLVETLQRELESIARSIVNVDGITFVELNAPPPKTFTGLTVLADGTNWNPGAGQGVYTFYNNVWNKLG